MSIRIFRLLSAGVVLVVLGAAIVLILAIPAGRHNGGPGKSAAASGTALTTIPPLGETAGPTTSIPKGEVRSQLSAPAPFLPPHTIILRHVTAPAVPIPTKACSENELSAHITSEGPYVGMGKFEEVVTVRSSVACFVDGYPTIAFGGVNAQIEDGGAVGNYPSPAPVALGPGVAASFMFQAGDMFDCQTASAMYFGVPSGPPQTPIAPRNAENGWGVCRGGIAVTPFEQGDSVDDYV